ncbi:MAG: type II toxin-antitoxin system RelE/ParE family toxin [Acidobacteriota bacterium]
MISEADIHPEASRELEEAALFYEQRAKGLGLRFLRAAEKAIEHILLFPEAAPVVGESVRQKALDRFPYSVLYVFEKSTIFFVAVAHHKKEPMYWRERLSG